MLQLGSSIPAEARSRPPWLLALTTSPGWLARAVWVVCWAPDWTGMGVLGTKGPKHPQHLGDLGKSPKWLFFGPFAGKVLVIGPKGHFGRGLLAKDKWVVLALDRLRPKGLVFTKGHAQQ